MNCCKDFECFLVVANRRITFNLSYLEQSILTPAIDEMIERAIDSQGEGDLIWITLMMTWKKNYLKMSFDNGKKLISSPPL